MCIRDSLSAVQLTVVVVAHSRAVGTGIVDVKDIPDVDLGPVSYTHLKENELIFGMLTPEVNNLKRVGYHPNAFIMGDDVANLSLIHI